MRQLLRPALVAVALFGSAVPLSAQRLAFDDDAEWLEHCQSGRWSGDDDRGRACEVRQVPVRLAGRSIEIDGRQNGSIRVRGWDGDSVRVTARLQANARSDDDARQMLKDVRIVTDGRSVRAEAPSTSSWVNREGWAASYVVWVPRRFDLSLEANNGSLGVDGVSGKLDLRTTNGSLALTNVGGDVHARTQNGSLNLQLAGSGWDGTGLDAETQNGSVRLAVPEHYAALLETGTVNGTINTDFPVTIQGRISRRLSLPLNGGGKTIRALTTNGAVRISRR
jgi:hypothetical protein